MLGMSLPSCCRFHPAEVKVPRRPDFGTPCCLRPSVAGSAFGSTHFRGHLRVHCCYSPVTRNLPLGDLVDRLQSLGFPPPCYPSYGAGTDLLYSAATKTAGSVAHGLARNIEWQVVRRLAAGSVPSAMVTLAVLSLVTQSQAARSLITVALCGSLLMTAVVLIFRSTIVQFYRSRFPALDDRRTAIVTVIVGVILGALVTISSVGAGAIGVCALVILYPQLPMRRIVGSDIAHAVPLTLVAGVGHWMIGTVDLHIIVALLVGSLPGIILGSYFAVRIAEPALRLLLAATLIVVAGKLLYDHFENTLSLLTAFARRAPR